MELKLKQIFDVRSWWSQSTANASGLKAPVGHFCCGALGICTVLKPVGLKFSYSCQKPGVADGPAFEVWLQELGSVELGQMLVLLPNQALLANCLSPYSHVRAVSPTNADWWFVVMWFCVETKVIWCQVCVILHVALVMTLSCWARSLNLRCFLRFFPLLASSPQIFAIFPTPVDVLLGNKL